MQTLFRNIFWCVNLFIAVTINMTATYATIDYVNNDVNELHAAVSTGTADTIKFNFSGAIDFSSIGVRLEVNRPLVFYSDAPRNIVFNGAGVPQGILVNISANVKFHGITFENFSGAAIEHAQGNLSIENCLFQNNAGLNGGAITSSLSGNILKVSRCSFFNNSATFDGGAIYGSDQTEVLHSTFFQNQCDADGGAIYYFDHGAGAAGVCAFNTFYANRAPTGLGGGIYTNNGNLALHNNLFFNNIASSVEQDFYSSVTVVSGGQNYWENSAYTNATTHGADKIGFSIAGDLRGTAVHDGYGQKYFPIINPSSQLIDVDSNFPLFYSEAKDQRGAPRALDGSGIFEPIPDVGAIEYTPFTVSSNAGDNSTPGALGQLINDMGGYGPPYYFAFDMPVSSSINVTTPFSDIVDKLIIVDGFTQEGSLVPGGQDVGSSSHIKSGVMGVELIGSAGIDYGLKLLNDGCDQSKISGISFMGFNISAVKFEGVHEFKFVGNHVGISADGVVVGGNGRGVQIEGGYGYIGGDMAKNRNVISGNTSFEGIGIELSNTMGTIIHNNLIGTNVLGIAGIANNDGIVVTGNSSSNKIGTNLKQRTSFNGASYVMPSNVISGNDGGAGYQSGIAFDGSGVHSNYISGNFIGPSIEGSQLSNMNFYGVSFHGGAIDNSVGIPTSAAAVNIISSNNVGIQFSSSAGINSVNNNLIGTGKDGLSAIPNNFGVYVADNGSGYEMKIGGPGLNEGNVISGNTTSGVQIVGAHGVSGTNRLELVGNSIGLGIDGIANIPNGVGVGVSSNAQFISIGENSCAGCGNLISANTNAGIDISDAYDVIIYNNKIGADINGSPAGNEMGILANNSSYVTIGGISANAPNEISHNTGNGVNIIGSSIGVDLSANSIFSNGGIGVDLNNDGTSPNDTDDLDNGPNDLQNYPVITQAYECSSGETSIEYILPFESGFSYAVQFFEADMDNEEGKIYLGEQIVTLTGTPAVSIYVHPSFIANGTVIVANASKINGTLYSSSEFSAAFTVTEPLIALTATNPSACGVSDGELILSCNPPLRFNTGYNIQYVLGGTLIGPAVHSTNSSGVLNLASLDTGAYTNIQIEIAGCWVNADTIAHLTTSVPSPTMTGDFTVCQGDIENYSVTGGGGSFSWSIGGGTLTPSAGTPVTATWNSISGTFISVTETIGSCTATDYQGVTVYILPSLSHVTTNPTCVGNCDGEIAVSIVSGPAPYSYQWDAATGGQTTATAIALCAGTFSVEVTDSNNCKNTELGTLVDPTAISLSTIASNETCFGTCDGSVSVSGTGGTGSLFYSWDGGLGTGSGHTEVCPGTYNVTAIDDNGCSVSEAIAVNAGISITALIDSVGNQCLSGNSFTFNGGNSTISSGTITSYSWDFGNGGIDSVVSPVYSYGAPGVYTITLIVGDGTCTDTTNFIVMVYPDPTVSITSSTNPTCNGFSDGDATAFGADGTLPFSYSWSPSGGMGTTASGLTAGIEYIVTVTDDNSCSAFDSVTLSDPSLLAVSITSSTNPTCNGLSDGTATALGVGGTVPLSYSWSPSGGTGITASGLTGGTEYVVTVTDSSSCSAIDSITLSDPILLSVSIASSTDPTCNGYSNGTATASGVGGTLPLSYSWSPSGGTGITASGLTGGTEYVVTVTDSNSCTAVDSVNLSDPPVISFSTTAVDATCAGVCDGEVSWTASGGTGIITSELFLIGTPDISQGSTNPTTGLCSGDYFVIHTDDNLCFQNSDTVIINDPPPLNLVITDPAAACAPFTVDLTAAAVTTGSDPGTLTYWTDFSATTPLGSPTSVATSGTYFIQLAGSSCTIIDSVHVVVNAQPNVEAGPDQMVCDGDLITVTGSGALSFVWDNTAVDGVPFGQAVGTVIYTVIGTDANGCEANDFLSITVTTLPFVEGNVVNATCGLSNGSVEAINATGGTLPYTYSFAGGAFSTATLFTGLGGGSYSLAIEDSIGCVYSTNVVVNSTGSLPLTPVLSGPYNYCQGDTLGPIDATGTIELGSFSWYINDTTSTPIKVTSSSDVTFLNLPAGSNVLYVIHTITSTGCSSIAGSANITYFNSAYTISSEFSVCPGGTIQFDGVLGNGAINWSNPNGELNNSAIPDPIANPANDSTIYVFDYQNGLCTFLDSVMVYLDTAGCNTLNDITNAFSPDGDGINDGWEIKGIDLYPNNQVYIFNRWGDLINQFVGYNNSDVVWTGEGSANETMASGTYYYIIEINDSNTSLSGWVQLTK